MTQQALIAAAKAPIRAYNKKNWEAVRAAVTPGFVYDEVASQRTVQGLTDVLRVWQEWARALPDSQATFDHALVSGHTVVLEVTWRGTHTGPLQTAAGAEIGPTGKPIKIRACQVMTVGRGKVRGMRHYFDMATLLQQLGVMS